MKYDVHIYAVCRIKVRGILADSPVQAAALAEKATDVEFQIRMGTATYADEIDSFLVDEVDEQGKVIKSHDLSVGEVDASQGL